MKIKLDDPINIYGIEIKEIQLKDSLLITTKMKSTTEPGVTVVYQQIKKLEDYAIANGAIATNSPMLHIDRISDAEYEYMVGLPVNKLMPQTDNIRIKRMPYGGNMLFTEIKGGPATVKKGLQLLDMYKSDAKRASPAIPFELLITNRTTEPDTTKWVTRLYYPVT